ncbi:MAG: fibronectin type III domain-containing protein [Lachnospiraceae bacterium]
MKKIKTLLATFMLLFFVAFLPQKTFAAETIAVTQVDDITDISGIQGAAYNVPSGVYEKMVSFTLKKPSYVRILAHSDVRFEDYAYLGTISNFAAYTDSNRSNLIMGDSDTGIPGGRDSEKNFCLDAGTYYIYFAKKGTDEYSQQSSGSFRLSVVAQSLNLTASKNGSWNKAKTIATDKSQTGFLSAGTRNSWFKFKLTAPATVSIHASIGNPLGSNIFELSKTGLTLYKKNHGVLTFTNIPDAYYSAVNTDSVKLAAGTYYIGITGDSYYSYGSHMDHRNNNMGALFVKVSTIKRTSITKCSNASGKKLAVTYKAVTGAKGYQIQYSTDKKFKTGVKTVTKNSKTTSVSVSKLQKNKKYYVRVRAYKVTEDKQKLYSSWSSVKNVTIKK